MNSREHSEPRKEVESAPEEVSVDETTGLQGLKSWRAVYFLVLASFVLWVGLLFALSRIFR